MEILIILIPSSSEKCQLDKIFGNYNFLEREKSSFLEESDHSGIFGQRKFDWARVRTLSGWLSHVIRLRYQLLSLTTKAKNLSQNSGPLFPGASWISFGEFGVAPLDFERVRSKPVGGDTKGREIF